MHCQHLIKVEADVSSDGEATRAIITIPFQDTVSVLYAVILRKEADLLLLLDLELGPGDGSVVEVATDALKAGGFSCREIAHEGSHAGIGEEHRVHLRLTSVLRCTNKDQLSYFLFRHT